MNGPLGGAGIPNHAFSPIRTAPEQENHPAPSPCGYILVPVHVAVIAFPLIFTGGLTVSIPEQLVMYAVVVVVVVGDVLERRPGLAGVEASRRGREAAAEARGGECDGGFEFVAVHSEGAGDPVAFRRALRVEGEVLPLAGSAPVGDLGARRRHPVGRGLDELDDARVHDPLAAGKGAHPHDLARDRVGN